MSPTPTITWTVQYTESGHTTYDYLDAFDRTQVRQVFRQLHPRARILVVREN